MGKFKDLTGMTFGELTVLYRVENKGGAVYFRCRCSCGVEKDVSSHNLLRGHAKSCGCMKTKLMSDGLHEDLTGKRFGRLVALEYLGGSNWKCQCDCGNTTITKSSLLKSGNTESCGCLAKERRAEGSRNALMTHGHRRSRLYAVWSSIKTRCYNPHNWNYKYYGGRGITMCDEWRNDFGSFYNWAMENGYDPDAPRGKCTIDRIDNDGNYCPENCRWVDMHTQRMNHSDNGR